MASTCELNEHRDQKQSKYYTRAGRLGLSSRLSFHVRKRMFDLFMQCMAPMEHMSILDLGVTCDTDSPESNYFEQFYPYKHRLVCAGTEPGHHLEAAYPGTRFVEVQSGQPLPFGDKQFDIVFSTAVIEHTGNRENQRRFLQEVLRVGKRFFLTTPNRWFPVEMHTGLPLVHFLPCPIHRALFRMMGHSFFASEANLNLLDRASFFQLFPEKVAVQIRRVKLAGFTSNLIAYGSCG